MTRRNLLLVAALAVVGVSLAAYYGLRRPTRAAMERYIPATALAFIEVENLPDVLDGLTDTRAWRELAPALGVSSQLRQLGTASDLVSRTGLGPDEAVVAGRAQYAVALTGFEAEAGNTPEGPFLRLRPRVALIIETHSKAEVADRIVRERAAMLAQRIYSEPANQSEEDYFGARLLIFQGPQPDRQFVAASSGSRIVIANHISAIKPCLDTISNRAESLATDSTLNQLRPTVDKGGAVFAFVTRTGIEKLAEFGPAIIASRMTTDPDKLGTIAGLFGHLSKQTTTGLLYGSEFTPEGVTERYLTVLRERVAQALAEPMKPAASQSFKSLELIPRAIEEFTVFNVEDAGELPERLLKQLTPNVDLVAGMAFREFVINFNRQLGLAPGDGAAKAVGSEVALVKFSDEEPTGMLISVKDRAALEAVVQRYLTEDAASVSSEQYSGIDIAISSNPDGRAAAFIGPFLTLATRDQIAKIVDARSSGVTIAADRSITEMLQPAGAKASIISFEPDSTDAGEMMLSVSKITRTTDGSLDLLESEEVRKAMDRLPPSVSFTSFQSAGIYTEVRSAVGSFGLLGRTLRD
ncbi:MAG TPA: hypothetical protein VJQ56_04665 [Blastocatellia bacterium]|nr:hypothetical protein [Blastocatellia bacterium]